ncbi:hypothetical protein, partial [uncultured Rhodoblastus sp.]|uniref:hypothetical protein n=1 Tax=uncultured Rhodoblastus sp. TaxID=543037 RepID=UPI0025E3C3E7
MHADNSIAKAGRPRVQLHLAFRNFRRELTLPPALALTSVGLVVALLVSCLGVGAWPMLRDDMLASLLRRQVRMQRAYEDRIADLGAQIDALSSRQRQDREAFELRVTEFAARQAQLETRTDRVAAIAAQVNPAAQFNAATTAIAIVARPALAKPAASARPAATAAFAPDGFDLRRTHPLDPPREDVSENAPPAPPEKSIGDLTRNFDRIEQRQIAALGSLSAPAAARAKRLRQAFDEAGLPVERLMRHADGFGAEKAGGAGGPFEPAPIEQCAKKWTPIFRKNIAKIKESSVDCDSSESQS